MIKKLFTSVLFVGVPGSVVSGLVFDKALGIKQYVLSSSSYVEEVKYSSHGFKCPAPSFTGEGTYESYKLSSYDWVACSWNFNTDWLIATVAAGIILSFVAYKFQR